MVTTALKVDGGWKLNGAKMWITNSPIADLAVVWAKDDDDKINPEKQNEHNQEKISRFMNENSQPNQHNICS